MRILAVFAVLASCNRQSFFTAGYESGLSADADADVDADSDADSDYDPEDEDSFLRLEPASTDAYVFVANPDRDTVTRVGVPTLDVITAPVGHGPEVVQTTSDYSTAVTFNMGSDDISIVDAATLAVRSVAVREHFNAMEMSPDGRWVMCWHDTSGPEETEGSGAAQSFNEVSFVDIGSGEHWPMVVGFNPRDVQFTEDGELAVVISDAYLAVVDLTEDEPSPWRIQISDDLVDPPVAEEVALLGDYAMVRQFDVSELVVVDLVTGDVDGVIVGENPTDLDLTPDGTQAVAVSRNDAQLWIYNAADPFEAPQVVDFPEDEVFGSLVMSPDDTQALLYSTASGKSRVGRWNRETDEVDVFGLVKPVETVGVSPDGSVALIFHSLANGDTAEDSEFYDHYAITLVDLSDFFTNPLLLPAEATAFAQSTDGRTGFFIMDGELELDVIHYGSLLFDTVDLASQPVHLGTLPDTTWAYVSQEHELGRISFYDEGSEELQTITGFELNSGIEH